MPREIGQDRVAEHDPLWIWDDVESWAVDTSKMKGIHESKPGILGSNTSNAAILAVCRDELKECLLNVVACTCIRDVIGAVQIDNRSFWSYQ